MPARTCASCGAAVGVMADRCPSCGADPDLQLLSVGGAGRPKGPTRRGRSGLDKRWLPVLAAVALVWAVLVATGDEQAGEQAADPSPTTGATAAVDPGPVVPLVPVPSSLVAGDGPLLGETTGLSVVVAGAETFAVDLDRATVRAVPTPSVVAAVQRGLLVGLDGAVWLWPPPFDGTGAVPFTTGAVDQAWVVAGGTQVWVARLGFGAHRRARLLNQSGSVLLDVALPPEAWPVGALDRGLVLSTPGATVLIDSQGTAHHLSVGSPFAAAGSTVYVAVCDTPGGALRCRYEVLDARGQPIDQPVSGDRFAGPVAVGPGPRLAHMQGTGADAAVAVDGAVVAPVGEAGVQALTWSAEGRWLFVATGGRLLTIDTRAPRLPVSVEVSPGGPAPSALWVVPTAGA